jgi:hypothetical protein
MIFDAAVWPSLSLSDVLLRVRCSRQLPHAAPQLDECHSAFVAVERWTRGNGWCRIRRHRVERILHGSMFPSQLADVDEKALKYEGFSCPVFRDTDCASAAGGKVGGGGGGSAVAALTLQLQLTCTMLSTPQPACATW